MDSTRVISSMEYFGENAYYTRNNNEIEKVKDRLEKQINSKIYISIQSKSINFFPNSP